MKEKVVCDLAPVPAAKYSQGIIKNNRMYVAGQGPLDVKTNTTASTIEKQTEQVLNNIKNILEKGGFGLNDVVKVNAYLSDLGLFEKFNSVYEKFFEEPYPVRTTIGCSLNNILVEIDVIAEK